MTRTLENLAISQTLRVETWEVMSVRPSGVDARSNYAERFWLPILGPSTTWLLRHLAQILEDSPSGATIDLAETARALGLGERSGRNGPLLRTIARAIDFGTITPRGPDRLGVRRALPLLSPRQVARLPLGLRVEHARHTARSEASPLDPVRRRGRRLALSLLELGEGVAEAERQLGNWHFHPAMAAECAAWANAERLRGRGESDQRAAPDLADIRPIAPGRPQLIDGPSPERRATVAVPAMQPDGPNPSSSDELRE